MHTARVHRKIDVQHRWYSDAGAFGLAAQPTIRVIGKVGDAYTSLRATLSVGNFRATRQRPSPRGAGLADRVRPG